MAPSKTSMKDFESLRESEIKPQYQLDESRNKLQEQKRYVEELRQELASQWNLLMQHLHPASPSIHSIQDDDDNNEQQDVHTTTSSLWATH